ncbi:MAG: shikimate kinase [Bacteroidota bacterium]
MRIFLLGYMGCGKSAIGKQLAKKLGFDFIDSDLFIENKCKKSIPEIFEAHGEEKFRELEQNCLKEIINISGSRIDSSGHVISTGGGTPCFYNNMELMNNSGITIYLQMSVENLMNRLIHQKKSRPLIKNLSDEELKDHISENLKKRENYYLQAKHIVNAETLKIDELIGLIAWLIR